MPESFSRSDVTEKEGRSPHRPGHSPSLMPGLLLSAKDRSLRLMPCAQANDVRSLLRNPRRRATTGDRAAG